MKCKRERTALVLSGGGVFAVYQAGAWNALAGELRPDIVIGTSAGALNAWAIASNCPAEELADRWIDGRLGGMISRKLPSRGSPAFFDDALLAEGVRHWWSAYRPVNQVGVVMMKLSSLSRRVVQGPQVTPWHLTASCALPGAFSPVWVDGGKYCDAGLLDAVNLWAAAELGATSVIAIDVMPALPLGILQAALGMAISVVRPSPPQRTAHDTLTLRPSRKLGGPTEMLSWNPGRVRDWIRLGEDDATELFYGRRAA
jgi:NTE family protein